jgi:3',5'-cyclic AMP phosphodiesterase CpdA
MITITHISDVHFGRTDPAIVDALVADVVERTPTVVVVSGDLTQRARAWQYLAASDFLKRLPQPQLVVPGNHDIPLYNVVRRIFSPLGNFQKYITQDLRPVVKTDDLLVIGINTARPITASLSGFWKDGAISEEQLKDVTLKAAHAPEGTFKIVVTHHPFIPPPGALVHGIVRGAARALETMQAVGVDMLLAGHLHMGYSGDVRAHHDAVKRSILSIQAGTATSTRRRGEPNAYNWITIDRGAEDIVTIEIRAWTGNRFDTHAVTRFARQDGQWRQM